MQPANFNLRETQNAVDKKLVKSSCDKAEHVSLLLVSSVPTRILSKIAALSEAGTANLTCSPKEPYETNSSLWLQPILQEDAEPAHQQNSTLIESLMPPPLHVCTNLTACTTTNLTTPWTSKTAGVFDNTLWFCAGRLMAGKYGFKLHVPLTQNGTNSSPVYRAIPINLDVRGRVCAKDSSVLLCLASETDVAGACRGISTTLYLQGERLMIQLTNLNDIDSLPIKNLAAVDSDTNVELEYCTPGHCETILLLRGTDESVPPYATLPVLSHAGIHNMTINHGDMPDCSISQTFAASCKAGYGAAHPTFKCIEAEEDQGDSRSIISGAGVGTD